MNDLVFTPAGEVPAHLFDIIAAQVDVSPVLRQVLAFAAAILVNLVVFATLQGSAEAARYAPPGEVVITQLESPVDVRFARN